MDPMSMGQKHSEQESDGDMDAVMKEADGNRKRMLDDLGVISQKTAPPAANSALAMPLTMVPASPSSKQQQKRLRANQDKNNLKKSGAPEKTNDTKSATSREEDRRANESPMLELSWCGQSRDNSGTS